jgi:hypothetical protein
MNEFLGLCKKMPGIVAIIFPFFPGAIWVQLAQDEP